MMFNSGLPANSFAIEKSCFVVRCCLMTVLVVLGFGATTVRAAEEDVDFITHVEPILRQHCYRCHGEVQSKGGLQLSRRSAALGVADSEEQIVVPGKPEQSLLLHRISDPDAGDLMPTDGEPLSKSEIETLTLWIKQGAKWPDSAAVAKHWSYQPIKRPQFPETKNRTWARNPIDHFVLSKLEQQGLSPSREIEKSRWIRRVSLSLTGLPPQLKDVDDFLADNSPEAYEKVVDRLLASQRFGEKWASGWLDLARYADSNGFQADQLRDSWAYRDWVINALNQGMPFDQFVIEQLAGDLLPNATFEQKVATGFHRTVTCNVEAGVHPEENRVNQVFDRVNTTGIVFMGTSLECAQCHDHKYDPFDQEDYYQLFSYFNNTPLEVKNTAGVTWDFYGPKMDLPLSVENKKQTNTLTKQLAELQKSQTDIVNQNKKLYTKWLEQIAVVDPEHQWQVLEVENFSSTGKETHEILDDGSVLVTGPVPGTTVYEILARTKLADVTAIKIEALTHESILGSGPGRGDKARPNFILSEFNVQSLLGAKQEKVEIAFATADYSQANWAIAGALDGDRKTGWAIGQQFSKPHWAIFTLAHELKMSDETQLKFTLDQNYGSGRTIGRIKMSVYSGDPSHLNVTDDIRVLAQKKKRTAKEDKTLLTAFEEQTPELAKLNSQIKKVQADLKKMQPPSTLVMIEMDEPRKTHILSRGNYLSPRDEVTPNVPKLLGTGGEEFPPNRLGFAQWLVSDHNPLLPRVTVNRWWAELFGQGIITTPEDLGSQGDLPTHPELLDWLASELKSNGWSMKDLLKTIVLSQTYRQSSQFTTQNMQKDPENKWCSRGPRFRLSAELIRDNALAISGLLSEKMAGPPVMPYQPDGIWRSIGRNQPKWVTADSEDRFRRGVYIIWKRDAPYPSLVSFDAPDRTACVVSRSKTNTPLQALTLLNDPAYSEMALALTMRMLNEPEEKSDRQRIIHGFRLCVSREPVTEEIDILLALLHQEQIVIKKNPELVKQRAGLRLAGFPKKTNNLEKLAVWFAISNALLNLDETITQ
ncbi:MAG: PSD1 domain-containing protein [Planctomycetaceae bacterium]|nr:PSD1 domain-containing protein [Planctomycetaceae bacterium]